jgi:S-adenosylmethionine synthetase
LSFSSFDRKTAEVRKNGTLLGLSDGKSQVTIEYSYGKPKRVDTVVISTQHSASMRDKHEEIEAAVRKYVIDPVLPKELVDRDLKVFVNPTGEFIIGGPQGDSGLTGRKIIVDTYGGMGRHGGGSFSGKDCTKVDRSASYATRWVAKNIVAAAWRNAAKFRFPMPSVWRNRSALTSKPSERERYRTRKSCGSSIGILIYARVQLSNG